jgi:hypothetical protein
MAKITLNTIGSRYGSIDALNDNFDAIEAAFENTLSRDGDTPNFMMTPLDMNGYDIVNVSRVLIGGVDLVQKLNDDYTAYKADLNTDYLTYTGDMTNIYNNYLSITQRVTISTAAPSGGTDGDIWFRVSA